MVAPHQTNKTSDREKLLFRSKQVLPSVAKAVPTPSLHFQSLSQIMFLLSSECFAAWENTVKPTAVHPSKKQQLPPHTTGTAEKPLASARSQSTAFCHAGGP